MGTGVDMRDLIKLREHLERANVSDEFCRALAKELAARLLRKVIKRTPVGDYSDTYDLENAGDDGYFLVMSDKLGGELRRAWTAEDKLQVYANGNTYEIEIKNSKIYASYVEYGHRQQPGRYVPAISKTLKKSFAPGVLMLTKSEEEIRQMAPAFIEKKLAIWLKEVLQ